jgi:hypothetical protein
LEIDHVLRRMGNMCFKAAICDQSQESICQTYLKVYDRLIFCEPYKAAQEICRFGGPLSPFYPIVGTGPACQVV